MEAGLAHVYGLREGRRNSWPIRPYEGIHGICTWEDYEEATFYMGCPGDVKLEPDRQSGGCAIPWLIHYAWGRETDRVIGYSEQGFEEGISVWSYSQFRRHKNHIKIGYSPVHSYKCASLEWARENYQKQVKRLERTIARRAKLRAEIPETIKVSRNKFYSGTKMGVFEKPNGVKELRPYFEERIPHNDKFEEFEEELVVAYETSYSAKDWYGTYKEDQNVAMVVMTRDGNGGTNYYMRRMGQNTLVEIGLEEPGVFRWSENNMPWVKRAGVANLVPGDYVFVSEGLKSRRKYRRLKAKELRGLMDKGVLKARV